ncbi:uncharacterized protein B0I36DRAFT_378859 [Microdochium trichocladiopsis]|uniref:Zn(2)-C6 fungal-type domain-containing protein n=1 Tax=Microdochium trichocladiopsis TaxID=1682393 RepID=A0A9P9BVM6_9PEZI|nr:uncharacterized protein B0I36DRAFT_378859 [Microdochium trichocladiopsis]KAH7039720.1 hypothetical protein B0I36DRAFT_378859 [Microdochium trichocladiopsis]
MTRHSKTRSGCRVCKGKRLKCDETKPSCLNCVRRGIQCPGYQITLRWSAKHQHSGPPSCAVDAAAARSYTTRKQTPKSGSAMPATVAGTEEGWQATAIPDHDSLHAPSGYASGDTLLAARNGRPLLPPSWTLDTESPAMLSDLPVTSPRTSEDTSQSVMSINCSLHDLGIIAFHDDQPSFSSDQTVPDVHGIPSATSHSNTFEDCKYLDTSANPRNTQLHFVDEIVLVTPHSIEKPAGHCYKTPSIPATLFDPSTMLVEFWFHSVCSGWAAYDSPSNPFRRLCASLWSCSAPVFYSMQTMAAASIQQRHHEQHWPRHWPEQIRQVVLAAPKSSTQALIQEISALFPSHGDNPGNITSNGKLVLPSGLLVSLFCMSSSLSWIDSHQLGTQYLRHARVILELFDLKVECLSHEDIELLEFFKGCLIYEQMLRSIVSDDANDVCSLTTQLEPGASLNIVHGPDVQHPYAIDDEARHATSLQHPSPPRLALHAWTGIPSMISWLFGKVMVLCRRSRALWRGSARVDFKLMHNAMAQFEQAKELEERLLTIDVWSIIDSEDEGDVAGAAQPNRDCHNSGPSLFSLLGSELGTYSEASPAGTTTTTSSSPSSSSLSHQPQTRQHIILAAEAYRLCSLLQLHQTFPDLVAQRMPQYVCHRSGAVPDEAWLQPLALHITGILESIPASSGMRCLQPLLCICAASGLRLSQPSSSATSETADASEMATDVGETNSWESCGRDRGCSSNKSSREDTTHEPIYNLTAPPLPLATTYYWEGFLPSASLFQSPSGSFDGISDSDGSSSIHSSPPSAFTTDTAVPYVTSPSRDMPSASPMYYGSSSPPSDSQSPASPSSSPSYITAYPFSPSFSAAASTNVGATPPPPDQPRNVQDARVFLRQRIRELQQVLPEKPLVVAGDLLEEMWSAMDVYRDDSLAEGSNGNDDDGGVGHARSGGASTGSAGGARGGRGWGGPHWLDLMSMSRFQSVFG